MSIRTDNPERTTDDKEPRMVCDRHSEITASLARIEQKLDDLIADVPAFVKDIEASETKIDAVAGIAKGTRSRLGWAIAIACAVLVPVGYLAVVLIEHIKVK